MSCTVARMVCLAQDISEAEGEVTKRQVQISSAAKQAEKLSKDCARTQKELDKATSDVEAKQREQEVTFLSSCLSYLEREWQA